MIIITEDFKNYKKSEIKNLLYMRVDELIKQKHSLINQLVQRNHVKVVNIRESVMVVVEDRISVI